MTGAYNLIGRPNPGAFALWTLYDPNGSVVTLSNPTHPLKEALALAGQAASTWTPGHVVAAGPGYDLFVRGFKEESGGPANLLIDDTCQFYPSQGAHYVFDCVSLTNDGCLQANKFMLQSDSMLVTRIEGPGSEIAMGNGSPPTSWAPNYSGWLIKPTAGVPQNPAPGDPVIADSSIYFTSMCSVAILPNGASVGGLTIDCDELNAYGSNIAFYVNQQGLSGSEVTGLVLKSRHLHGFKQCGVSIGLAPASAPLGIGGNYDFGISADGLGGTVAFQTFGSNDDVRLNIYDPALTTPVYCAPSSAHNRFRVPYSAAAMPTSLLGTDNLFSR